MCRPSESGCRSPWRVPGGSTQIAICEQIMAGGILKVKEVESVERIIELLRNSSHNGFPVVLGERPVINHDAFGSQQARSEVSEGPDGRSGPLHWAQDDSNPTPGALKGMILRSQLLVLLTRRVQSLAIL